MESKRQIQFSRSNLGNQIAIGLSWGQTRNVVGSNLGVKARNTQNKQKSE